jgi:hypothetical protein
MRCQLLATERDDVGVVMDFLALEDIELATHYISGGGYFTLSVAAGDDADELLVAASHWIDGMGIVDIALHRFDEAVRLDIEGEDHHLVVTLGISPG